MENRIFVVLLKEKNYHVGGNTGSEKENDAVLRTLSLFSSSPACLPSLITKSVQVFILLSQVKSGREIRDRKHAQIQTHRRIQ